MTTTFGEAIKAVRQSAGLQQKYVAYTSGIEPKTYSKIETGNLSPTEEELDRIAVALEVSVSELIAKWSTMMKESPTGPRAFRYKSTRTQQRRDTSQNFIAR